jgi:hypothetical protein
MEKYESLEHVLIHQEKPMQMKCNIREADFHWNSYVGDS